MSHSTCASSRVSGTSILIEPLGEARRQIMQRETFSGLAVPFAGSAIVTERSV